MPIFCAGVGTAGSSFPWYYYTQCEVCLGVLRGVRLGVNPGELLDFLLGWTTLDTFNDDLEQMQRQQESEKINAVTS